MNLSHGEVFERFNNLNFRLNDTGFGVHTEYFKRATIDFNYTRGTRINYDTPDSLPAFRGNSTDAQVQLTLRPTSRLKIDEIYYYTHLATRTDSFFGMPLPLLDRPAAVFINHLVRSRVNYQFTREFSLRMIVDYNGVLPNQSLINLDRQKSITGDLLLTYLIHPGTALYLGYNDRLENRALVPGLPPTIDRTGFPSVTTGRQFFAKISYLFRF